MMIINYLKKISVQFAIFFVLLSQTPIAMPQTKATPGQLQEIRNYIKKSWTSLSRSNAKLAEAAVDPKFKGQRPILYVSRKENLAQVKQSLQSQMSAADFAKLDIRELPANVNDIQEQGLLYLPHPYVVPGGRFNEMYGWDSYFIQVGLLLDDETTLAKGMIENFLYETENYGAVLNAKYTFLFFDSFPTTIFNADDSRRLSKD